MNPEAVSRLRRVKGGTDRQGIPLIAADLEQVLACTVDTSGRVRRLADRWWPGPLTLVVHATVAFADGVRAHDGSVAIRVPAHDVARSIAEGVGGPITSTSANRSGELAPMDASAIVAELVSTLAMVVDAGATAGGQPSTIVDVRGLELRLVRPGRVPWNRVLESAES
jgi:L-threonylcarbamoyladenylate synthase